MQPSFRTASHIKTPLLLRVRSPGPELPLCGACEHLSWAQSHEFPSRCTSYHSRFFFFILRIWVRCFEKLRNCVSFCFVLKDLRFPSTRKPSRWRKKNKNKVKQQKIKLLPALKKNISSIRKKLKKTQTPRRKKTKLTLYNS